MSDTKDQLLSAASEIFSRQGYDKTKVSDITKQAGVGHGTFYHYFKSKKDIFLELIKNFLFMLNNGISTLSIENAETREEIEDNIKDLYRVIFKTYQDNLHMGKMFFEETINEPEIKEIKSYFYKFCTEFITKYIQTGVEKGLLREYNTEVIAYAIIGMAKEVAAQYLKEDGKYEVEYLVENMAIFEAYGLIK